MHLAFAYQPVSDIDEALRFYRDTLGLAEAWREGTDTVAFEIPGAEAQLMIDLVPGKRAGPVFIVDSLLEFHDRHAADLNWVEKPKQIPGGYWGEFADPAGNPVYVMDQSTADEIASG